MSQHHVVLVGSYWTQRPGMKVRSLLTYNLDRVVTLRTRPSLAVVLPKRLLGVPGIAGNARAGILDMAGSLRRFDE
jgi:hypothetical protein